MKYLIIGGTSLFGKVLMQKLAEENDTELIVATKLPIEKPVNIPRVIWNDMDVQNPLVITELLSKEEYNVIFDFAVQNSVGYAWSDPGATIDINVSGLLNLLDAVRQCAYVPRIVLAGSGEEYGRISFVEMPIKETTKVNPENIFAASKNCQTMLAELYGQAYQMDINIIRTFNEIGPGQSERFVVSNLCKQFAMIQADLQNPVIYVGNLNVKRDFTDVRDLVKAFIAVAKSGKKGEIYNAGRGHAVTIREIIQILQEQTGISVKIQSEAGRMRLIDTPIFEADCHKIYADTGWKAQIPLEQTVRDMVEYWRAN